MTFDEWCADLARYKGHDALRQRPAEVLADCWNAAIDAAFDVIVAKQVGEAEPVKLSDFDSIRVRKKL